LIELIDFEAYFRLIGEKYSLDAEYVSKRLVSEGFAIEDDGKFSITNYGAILFAKNLSSFPRLSRKKIRIITYKDTGKFETLREKEIDKGYAAGFIEIMDYVRDQLPRNEQIGRAVRISVTVYPELSLRELIANTLIHQDFSISGAGPMIEIFSNRIDISNPGTPLVEVLRLIDQPPRSRNERIAGFMRRANYCEERGSGIDKVITEAEVYQLPPPNFRISGDNMTSTLYSPKSLQEMDSTERIRACYQHAALSFIIDKRVTNTTIRERFGIEQQNYPAASKILSETVKSKLIKVYDNNVPKNQRHYVPFWA
jgi:ATP-dependent DNA helicase RecG